MSKPETTAKLLPGKVERHSDSIVLTNGYGTVTALLISVKSLNREFVTIEVDESKDGPDPTTGVISIRLSEATALGKWLVQRAAPADKSRPGLRGWIARRLMP